MAFKQGENIASKGKLYPVFIADDGNMYGVLSTEEQVEILQMLIPMAYEGNIKIDTTPLRGDTAIMKLSDIKKLKK